MSAAAEYYGYLLSQGYGEHQLNKFANYAQRANRGEISHNKAYRLACKAGFGGVSYNNMTEQEASDSCESKYNTDAEVKSCVDNLLNDSDKKGSFGDWMKTAQSSGWIDKGLGILRGSFDKGGSNGGNGYYEEPPPPNNTAIYVISGLAVVGVGVAIYLAIKK